MRLSLMGMRVQIFSSRGKRAKPAIRSSVDDLPADSEPTTTMLGRVTLDSVSMRRIILVMRP
eukprot:6651072-Prymnesium_polylepis.1